MIPISWQVRNTDVGIFIISVVLVEHISHVQEHTPVQVMALQWYLVLVWLTWTWNLYSSIQQVIVFLMKSNSLYRSSLCFMGIPLLQSQSVIKIDLYKRLGLKHRDCGLIPLVYWTASKVHGLRWSHATGTTVLNEYPSNSEAQSCMITSNWFVQIYHLSAIGR